MDDDGVTLYIDERGKYDTTTILRLDTYDIVGLLSREWWIVEDGLEFHLPPLFLDEED